MAIFNLLAKTEIDVDFNEIFDMLILIPRKYIYIFPVISVDLKKIDGLGVTASGKDHEYLSQIKDELIDVFKFLWDRNFTIKDLYTGDILTVENYKKISAYYWE